MLFEPINKNQKIYMAVMNQVKALIKQGHLAPGDRLPSERKLAQLLEVSRASVGQAMSTLEAMGIVEIRLGDGTYIARNGSDERLIESFSQQLIKEQISPFEILEARKMVECYCARLCAERANSETLHQLHDFLSEYYRRSAAKEPFPELNNEFHRTIAVGTNNRSIMKLMDELLSMMKLNLWPKIKGISYNYPDRIKQHWQDHEEIYKAISERNPTLAYEKMREHLDDIEHDIQHDLDGPEAVEDNLFL